jgi:Sigma-70, region 4.
VAEIAATLNLSTDAVKQRLVRARQQLREAYESL